MKRTLMLLTAAAMAAAVATTTFGAPDDGPPGPPPPEAGASMDAQSLSGTVKNFNYGPRGNIEGLLLSSGGKVVQVNFPPPLAQEITQSVAVGDQIKVDVQADQGPRGRGAGGRGPGGQGGPDNQNGGAGDRRGPRGGGGGGGGGGQRGGGGGPGGGGPGGPPDQSADRGPGGPGGGPQGVKPDHAVYRLVSLTDAKGHELTDGPQAGGKPVHVEGTVSAMNYDPRGRPNGVQLSTGDFVRINPQDMAELKLAVGASVKADGSAQPLATGKGQLIDASSINGTEVHAGPPRGRGGPGGPRGGDNNDGPPGPPPPNDGGPQ